MGLILTEEELQFIRQAFDSAVKSSPDSIAASSVLGPIFLKIIEINKPEPNSGNASN